MNASLVVAGKDLRQRLRDKTAYIVGVAAPLVLAGLITLALGRANTPFHATYALVDLDRGPVATAFVTGVLQSADMRKVVKIRTVASEAEAARLAEDDKVAAAIVIPRGFSAVAEGAAPVPLRVVRSDRSTVGAEVAVSIAQGFMAHIEAVRLSVLTALASGARDQAALVEKATQAPAPVDLAESATAKAGSSAGGQWAPAMGVFFMFFVVSLQARGLVAERKQGTMARLLAAPVTIRSVLLGKGLAAFALGTASLATMAVASRFLLHAEWGNPVAAAGLIASTVFAVTGVVALVLTLARTEQQAATYTSLVTFGFALLGGNFIDLSQAPELMRRLSLLTPNGWALRSFGDLAAGAATTAGLLTAVAAIIAFGAVACMLAALRSDKLVAP